MKTSEIISLARGRAYTSSTIYPDSDAIIDINVIYRDLIAQLNQDVNEDLFADYFYTDSILGQQEYTLPAVDNTNKINGLGNLLNVYVNYTAPVTGTGTVATTNGSNVITGTGTTFTSTFKIGDNIIISGNSYRVVYLASNTSLTISAIDTSLPTSNTSGLAYKVHKQDYVKVTPTRASNLQYPVEYYLTNQPKTEPFYIKFDHSIFVYPMPDVSIPLGVKLHGTYDVFDLTYTSPDSTPIIDDNWHYVLAIGLKKKIFDRRGMLNEAQQAYNEYMLEYKKMINTSSDSELSPMQRVVLSLNELQ